MAKSITDLFRPETEFNVKASELYGLMKEAAKADFLLNAAKCDIPHTFARQIATGEKEDAPLFVGIDFWQRQKAIRNTRAATQPPRILNISRN